MKSSCIFIVFLLYCNVLSGQTVSIDSSNIHITSSVSGESTSDGLHVELNGLSGSILNKEAGQLSLGSGAQAYLHILPSGRMGLNTNQTLGSADFTIRSISDFFGGMFIDSPNGNNDGKPFYGYALDRDIAFYHYYDAVDDKFKFQFNGISGSTLSISKDGCLLLNTETPTNLNTDFTIQSKRPIGFGGMYIDSEDVNTGKPFYGYAIDGQAEAFHYYDTGNSKWVLNVGSNEWLQVRDNGNVGIGVSTPEEKLVINGRLRLASASSASAENGTIVFNGNNFYGRINGLWYKMTAATGGLLVAPDEEEVIELKADNKLLLKKVDDLEERLTILEKIILEQG